MTDYERGLREGRAETRDEVLRPFLHVHSSGNRGILDECKICGLDIRHAVHVAKAPQPPRKGGDGGGKEVKNIDLEVADRFRFLAVGVGSCSSVEEAVKFMKKRANDIESEVAKVKQPPRQGGDGGGEDDNA